MLDRDISVHICQTARDFEIAKSLTKDYMEWLAIDLYFQAVDYELKHFERMNSKLIKNTFIHPFDNNKI